MLIPDWTDIWILTSPRYMPVYAHAHDFIELIFVYQGSCKHTIRGHTEQLHEGDIYILPPNMAHRIEVLNDDCIVFHIMVRCSAFNLTFLSLLKTHNAISDFLTRAIYASSDFSIKFQTGDTKVLKKIVRNIYLESLEKNEYTAIMMETMFQLLCIHLAQYHLTDMDIKANGKKLSYLSEILEYISIHYRDVTLAELAQQCNYSEGHLRRLISSATGKTFKEIVTDQRLIHAKLLLETSDQTVSEIAENTGFGDVRNMQRLFKSKYQKSPTEFRRR